MSARLKLAARWLLVLATVSLTTFAVIVLLMDFMLWPDRSLVAVFTTFGVAPRATIEAMHQFDFFLAMLIWVVPPAWAIGFAARLPQRRALAVGLSISIVLSAAFRFFIARSDHSGPMEWAMVITAVIVVAALIFSFFRSNQSRALDFANFVAVLLLFGHSAAALSHRAAALPQSKQLWSGVLQQNQLQEMNTGSEYAATRQVAFAGDRVVVVFDAGFAPYQPPSKWPISNYRIMSLDSKTGLKLNEITIPGRWGGTPYIYPTQQGLIDVQSNPPRILNPDLMPVTDESKSALVNGKTTRDRLECGDANCSPQTYLVGNNTLQLRRGQFQVVDSTGHILSSGNLLEWGNFAGASANGRRFAIQSSYMEGDPDFVVYEYFTIYDAANGHVLTTIQMRDLPARQSWSAFSPDGRYFVAGNPNRLTMYELP